MNHDSFDEDDAPPSEEEHERQWQIIANLENKLHLQAAAKRRHMVEQLPVPRTLGAWKAWLIDEALIRALRGVCMADPSLLLAAATIIRAIADLDELGIRCSQGLSAYPSPLPLSLPDNRQQGDNPHISQSKEELAWSSILALRLRCQLTDLVLEARTSEGGLPIPLSLQDWLGWLIYDAIDNILIATANHDNPGSGCGSAWLFRLGAMELGGAARLGELGVRPSPNSPLPTPLTRGSKNDE